MVLNKIYIPIGFQCCVPETLQSVGLKTRTLPFDWMLSTPEFVYQILDFLLIKNMDIHYLVKYHFFACDALVQFQSPECFLEKIDGDDLYNKKYNVIFPHDKDYDKDIEKYCRRFHRLKAIILDSNLYPIFVYISPSSNGGGNYKINEKIIIKDSVYYLNKIYEMISNIRGNSFDMLVLDSTNIIENIELNKNIKYETITPMEYYPHIVHECSQKIKSYDTNFA